MFLFWFFKNLSKLTKVLLTAFVLLKSVLGVHWKDWCWSWNSQYFGHLMQRADSFEKPLMLGKIEGRRRRGWQRARWLDGITSSMDMNLDELQDMVRDWEAWSATVPRVTKSQTQLSEWTTTKDTRWEGEGKCPVLSYFLPSWEAAKKNQAKCILKFHIEISGMG